jgi:hypothetical protein
MERNGIPAIHSTIATAPSAYPVCPFQKPSGKNLKKRKLETPVTNLIGAILIAKSNGSISMARVHLVRGRKMGHVTQAAQSRQKG